MAIPGAEPRTKWTDAVGESTLTIPKVMNGVKVLNTPLLRHVLSRRPSVSISSHMLSCRVPTCLLARKKWREAEGLLLSMSSATSSNDSEEPYHTFTSLQVLAYAHVIRVINSQYVNVFDCAL
jgi:hypothetical protein